MPQRYPALAPLHEWSDFAKVVTAAEGAFGFPRYTTLRAIVANQDRAADSAIDESPLAQRIIEWMKEVRTARLSAGELLEAIGRSDAWADKPKAFRNEFVALLPALARKGVTAQSVDGPHNKTFWLFRYTEPGFELADAA